MPLFHNATFFGSCVIHILYAGVLKLKKKKSGAKGLKPSKKLCSQHYLLSKSLFNFLVVFWTLFPI